MQIEDKIHAITSRGLAESPAEYSFAAPFTTEFNRLAGDIKTIVQYLKDSGEITGSPEQFDAETFRLVYHKDGEMFWAEGLTGQGVRDAIKVLIRQRGLHFDEDAIIAHIKIHESQPTEEQAIRAQVEEFKIACIKNNIDLTNKLIEDGQTPEVIGTVSGSASAKSFWQGILNKAKDSFKAKAALSFHEDLPVNQAFGILLLRQRLEEHIKEGCGSLIAFVFGSGTRSTPLTETDCAQKPAIGTFVTVLTPEGRIRYLSIVELALMYFIPVQQYLKSSGFKGLVIKWGDEVQIPTLNLSGSDPLFRDADIVRFVSIREMNEDEARNKDWVGVNAERQVTAFIPRRPLSEMAKLADRGLIQRRAGKLYGGINLGSIAVSYALLDVLLEEFRDDVNMTDARRSDRPALDPEFFTALCIALIEEPAQRNQAWQEAISSNMDVKKMSENMPDVLERIRKAVVRFKQEYQRPVKMAAMDFGDQYWGDIGQHKKIYAFYTALNAAGADGEIARAIAGISGRPDGNGNIIFGNCHISPNVKVMNSVLVNAVVTGSGAVESSVLIGTQTHDINVKKGFDFCSITPRLYIEERGGTYKCVWEKPVYACKNERLTVLFMPACGARILKVMEGTDLRDKERNYNVPVFGNTVSFKNAHEDMGRMTIEELDRIRSQTQTKVEKILAELSSTNRAQVEDSVPLKTKPHLARYSWAGEGLGRLLKVTERVAEIWAFFSGESKKGNQADKIFVRGLKGITFKQLIAEHPEMIGAELKEKLFFVKFLGTDFSPVMFVGFSPERVKEAGRQYGFYSDKDGLDREKFKGWYVEQLIAEKRVLSELLEFYRKYGQTFQHQALLDAYKRWALAQDGIAWEKEGRDVGSLDKFFAQENHSTLHELLNRFSDIHRNVVYVMHRLECREDKVLWVPSPTAHGLQGLSLQYHPAGRDSKSEMWGYALLYDDKGKDIGWVIIEPQETSNVTFSLSDPFIPIVFKEGEFIFRKTVTEEYLKKFINEMDMVPHPEGDYFKNMEQRSQKPTDKASEAWVFVDKPEQWPFFSGEKIRLHGKKDKPALYHLGRKNSFLEAVATRGNIRISWRDKTNGSKHQAFLTPPEPVFLPCTIPADEFVFSSSAEAQFYVFWYPLNETDMS